MFYGKFYVNYGGKGGPGYAFKNWIASQKEIKQLEMRLKMEMEKLEYVAFGYAFTKLEDKNIQIEHWITVIKYNIGVDLYLDFDLDQRKDELRLLEECLKRRMTAKQRWEKRKLLRAITDFTKYATSKKRKI